MLSNISQNFTTIEHFMEEQQQQCQHATKAFEQIVDKLQALAREGVQGRDDPCSDRYADAPISTTMAPSEPVDGKGAPSHAPARQVHGSR